MSVITLICIESLDTLTELDRAVEELEKSIGTSNFHWAYARTLKKVLRDKGITVKKLKTVSDESYPSIRIADAVKEATKLYKALEPKIKFIHLQK